jgi:hypothetical protein
MSVTLTEDAVREWRKTVTRRLGWTFLKPGDRLTLCRKVMGRRRKDGTVEPLVRIAEVEVLSVRRERLDAITTEDVWREGFNGYDTSPAAAVDFFVEFFCAHMRCSPSTEVTRIEWRYLEDAQRSGEAAQDPPEAS